MKTKRIYIFSMSFMAILLVLFAVSMAWATFIERDYGTAAAQQVVFNAKWFEIIILLLAVNLIGNIIINKLYAKSKLTLFIFHIAFIIIIIGAAITRYFGFEGIMHIREGDISNEVQTNRMYIHSGIKQNGHYWYSSTEAEFSPFLKKTFKTELTLNNKKYFVSSQNYIAHAKRYVSTSENGLPVIEVVAGGINGRKEYYIQQGESQIINGIEINFTGKSKNSDVDLFYKNNGILISSRYDITASDMTEGRHETLKNNTEYPLQELVLYNINGQGIVFSNIYSKAKILYTESEDKNNPDVVFMEIKNGHQSKTIVLTGREGYQGNPVEFKFMGESFILSYGPSVIKLPFALKLNKFILKRYPASNSPSSYESYISVYRGTQLTKYNREVSMNNILRYGGYRFYQSSYDQDEKGTVFSVNYDTAGSTVTYIGYILLALGMLLSIFNRHSRLRKLSASMKIIVIFMTIMFFIPNEIKANSNIPLINYEHARKADFLMVQDNKGRIKPFNTLSSELLRKIYRNDKFRNLHSNQVILGMMVNPHYWQQQPMIKIGNDELRNTLGIEGKYAAFVDFFRISNGESSYILADLIEQAFHKKPGERNKFDNEVIKADERLNIAYMIYFGYMFKALPAKINDNFMWYSYSEIPDTLLINDSIRLNSIIPVYFSAIEDAQFSGNWKDANDIVTSFIIYQRNIAGENMLPSENKIKTEVLYNELEIFIRLSEYYGFLGIVFLILLFISEVSGKITFKKVKKILTIISILLFIVHTAGLSLRWYISGHAPWSNGYESLLYISWATMLAGVIFSKQSLYALASTSLLASVLLSTAHLSWLDPEITNLVPVLKSYWLTIHVSVITASYGFLALSALLAANNLILMILKTPANNKRIEQSIIKLSGINEMSVIIGLYLLTIGTFLGGVWANESWGRYWGWDPKETWALITVIVYAFIAHMKYIPGLKSFYTFNLLTLLGYGSVIMTYFGVNYYLAGLHSYAKGDPIPLPVWVYYVLIVIFILALTAWINNYRIDKIKK